MINLEEAILHLMQMLLTDSDTAIHHFNKSLSVRLLLDNKMNPAVLIREFNRVVNKIKENLFEAIAISIYKNSLLCFVLQLHLNSFLLGFSPNIKHSLLEDLLQINDCNYELHLILLQLGEIEHFLNQTNQPIRFLSDNAHAKLGLLPIKPA
ncbi:hypothetical protein D3C74_329910 [compost metagenome]